MTKIEKIAKLSKSKPIEVAGALMSSFELYLRVMFYLVNESPFLLENFHSTVCKALENIVLGRCLKRNLCLNIPVGAGKSLIVEYFISWCFARTVNNAFIYISHSDKLINKLSKETKEICEHPEWVRLFGSELQTDQKSKVNWSFQDSKNRTGLMAGTMGGGITGLDAGNPNINGFSGALIIDDPIDAVKVRYELAREECKTFYTDKLETRRRTPTTPAILIMQRLHKDDLAGYLEILEPGEWEFVKVPALVNGKSFWAARYPVQELEKIQATNAFKFAAQYQQNPVTSGGQVIKSKWFKYYNNLEDLKFKKVFLTGDTAQKTKEHNDFSVFAAWGVSHDNFLYLLDMVRGKWEAPELEENAKNFWSKWKNGINNRQCSGFYIEDKASGTGLIQSLRSKYFMPIIPIQRNVDKLTRLEDVLTYIAAGQLWLPFSAEYAFNPELISEAESFARDMSHAHDDIIDNIIDGIEIGISTNKVTIFDVL